MMHRLVCAACAVLFLGNAATARAYDRDDDPYAYDLRSALFPLIFVGGIPASYLGSAARIEADFGRRVTVQLAGRYDFAPVIESDAPRDFDAGVGVFIHLSDRVNNERLGGTVYPEDTPAAGAQGRATDRDLEVPMSNKLGGPRLTLPEKERDRVAPIRLVHSLRLGLHATRAVVKPERLDESADPFVESTYPALTLGYGWGNHYNLSAATAGSREVGFRRYYVDLVVTLPSLMHVEPASEEDTDPFPVGVRIGMEGTIAGLLRGADGVGLGYTLALGAMPGRSGIQGYLMLALGVALDFSTRREAR